MFSTKNGKVFIFLVKLYKRVLHPNVFSKKMEKSSYFWLNYIEECSTLTFSTKNGKVFVFLVKLYKRVLHPNVSNYMGNFLSLWGWEGDWSPTGCQLVTLPYLYRKTGHLGGHIAIFHVYFGGCLAIFHSLFGWYPGWLLCYIS